MAQKLPQNLWNRSASVGRGNPGTMLRASLALLARLERAAGPAGPTAALPQNRFNGANQASFSPGRAALPWAEQPCTTPCDDWAWQKSAAASGPSLRKRSESLSSVGILLILSEGSRSRPKGSPRVPRRSNSRLSRREASLLVLSKKGSSFAVARNSFSVSNHSSSSLSAGMSATDRKPKASKASAVGRQKFNSLEGSQ